MSHHTSSSRHSPRPTRPPGQWHSIPAGVRGAIVSFGLLLVGFFIYRISLSAFNGSGIVPPLIGYLIQLFVFYVLNGMLAGWQADETRAAQTRKVGFRGETVRLNLANYIGNGALAGIALAAFMLIAQLMARSTLEQFDPGMQLLSQVSQGDSAGLFVLVDTLGAIAFGMIGGAIYDRVFAAPGRR